MVHTRSQDKKRIMDSNIPTTDSNKNMPIAQLAYYYKMFVFSPIGGFICIILSTVLIHWSLINLYVLFCAPPTIWGLFQTMLSLGSPMCHFINIVQAELAKHYITIWGSAAVAIFVWMASLIKGNPNEN